MHTTLKPATPDDHPVPFPMVLHPRVVTGSGGGPDKTILNSPRFLKPLGFNSACLYLRPPGDAGFRAIRDRAEDWNAPLEEMDDRGATDWRIVPQTVKLCRRLNVKIWHGHDYKTNLLGLLVKRWHPMKLVTTVHGWVQHTRKTPLYYTLDRWAIKRYDQVLCVSPDLLETCRKSGVHEGRSQLVENAIDTEQFRRRCSQVEAKRKLGLPENQLLIGAVGRLSPEKGFDQLIRSVVAIKTAGLKTDQKLSLVIIGDGVEQERLQAQIDESGYQDDIRLAGFQSNTSQWYEAMDVYALSSLREGLPNVILEAMAFETPIVATRVAGVPRIIEDGKNGLIVPIDDELALKLALEKLLSNAGLRDQLASAGRKVIESRYSFAMRMKKISSIYQKIL